MLVCFGKDICRAVTDSHLANLLRDLNLLRVSAAFSLRAVMFKPILQSQRSARAVHGLPWWVIHGRCVRNCLGGKSPLLERGSSTKLGPKLLGRGKGFCLHLSPLPGWMRWGTSGRSLPLPWTVSRGVREGLIAPGAFPGPKPHHSENIRHRLA